MTKKQIVITGTFDILHPGHVFLIREAAKLGEVTVVIARDENVVHTKGHPVIIPEQQRLFMVEALKGVSKAVLGNPGSDFVSIIEELKPDVLMLGPNQDISMNQVQNRLREKGLATRVIRLKELFDEFPLSSTSRIIEKALANQKDRISQ
ncbi:MAG: adenylyltransferase/cytidyltransferase family protein [Promethearchaeota archaeon]